jgi:integrase
MSRRSKKSVEETLSTSALSPTAASSKDEDIFLDKKILLTTEGFPITTKYCELILRDGSRLSRENALVVCDYIIAMKREINPRPNTVRTTIQFLSELSKSIGIEKRFEDMTRDDVLSYLDSCRKLEDDDPLHKWIGSYNSKRTILFRFFKWLYYSNVASPDKRIEISNSERKPECIQDIPQLKRKEVSCYKPSDLWSQEDDLLFLKWVTNKRDRCYHTMSRDLSARPHEILNLKIKDIVFKTVDNGKYQYAEVLVNGKTGSRHIPLIQSIPYIKDWLSNHPSRNNPKSPLFVSLDSHSMGRRQLTLNGLYKVYRDYKEEFFPKLLADLTVSNEDKDKIKNLLAKKFNPYVRRHSALTEKSTKLKSNTLNQHAGWSMNSNMAQKYIHYFGNESSESLLEAYGIVTKNNVPIDTLNPKMCPNCNEGNTQDAKFCAKCRMVLTYDAYGETLEKQQEKELEVQNLKGKYEQDMKAMREEMENKFQQILAKIDVATLK